DAKGAWRSFSAMHYQRRHRGGHEEIVRRRTIDMCGIAGWLLDDRRDTGAADLRRMLKSIGHRGPGDTGTYIAAEHNVALGHNRFSIIDLSAAGHQPMVNTGNGDVLTFNGEVYNFRELRHRLQAKGYRFHSECDTEVLLHAFAAWGTECVHHIRGMYA